MKKVAKGLCLSIPHSGVNKQLSKAAIMKLHIMELHSIMLFSKDNYKINMLVLPIISPLKGNKSAVWMTTIFSSVKRVSYLYNKVPHNFRANCALKSCFPQGFTLEGVSGALYVEFSKKRFKLGWKDSHELPTKISLGKIKPFSPLSLYTKIDNLEANSFLTFEESIW